MIRHHLGKGITEPQRKRWVALLLETADELQLPGDSGISFGSRGVSGMGFATGRHQLSPIAGYGRHGATGCLRGIGEFLEGLTSRRIASPNTASFLLAGRPSIFSSSTTLSPSNDAREGSQHSDQNGEWREHCAAPIVGILKSSLCQSSDS